MIIFDLDGTLWDSAENVAVSWNHVAEQEGKPICVTAEDIHRVMGMTMEEIANTLMAEFDVEMRSDIFNKCSEYEIEYLMQHGGQLFEGVRETLEKLHDDGYKLAIVTNGQANYVSAFMKSMNMEHLFCDYEEWGRTFNSKADNIKLVMARQGETNAVYVGDIQNDANSAAEAGIPCISAEYGFGHIENPIARLEKFCDIIEVIKSIKC